MQKSFRGVMLLLACAACGSSHAPQAGMGPMAAGRVGWLINHEAFNLIVQQGSDAAALAQAYFANSQTYYIAPASTDPSTIPSGVIPTVSFTSLADIQGAISRGLPSWVKAVIYDNENWSFTPSAEQQDPKTAYAQAGTLVHGAGLVFIAVPATNLVHAIEPAFTGSIDDEFVRLNIAGAVAPSADVYEMQSQGIESDSAHFTSFVSQTAAQARAANAHVKVFAGLSTNPTGHSVVSAQLFSDVQSTLGTAVAGYWMNIPAASPYCPSCGTPQPQVAVGLLQSMQAAH